MKTGQAEKKQMANLAQSLPVNIPMMLGRNLVDWDDEDEVKTIRFIDQKSLPRRTKNRRRKFYLSSFLIDSFHFNFFFK